MTTNEKPVSGYYLAREDALLEVLRASHPVAAAVSAAMGFVPPRDEAAKQAVLRYAAEHAGESIPELSGDDPDSGGKLHRAAVSVTPQTLDNMARGVGVAIAALASVLAKVAESGAFGPAPEGFDS